MVFSKRASNIVINGMQAKSPRLPQEPKVSNNLRHTIWLGRIPGSTMLFLVCLLSCGVDQFGSIPHFELVNIANLDSIVIHRPILAGELYDKNYNYEDGPGQAEVNEVENFRAKYLGKTMLNWDLEIKRLFQGRSFIMDTLSGNYWMNYTFKRLEQNDFDLKKEKLDSRALRAGEGNWKYQLYAKLSMIHKTSWNCLSPPCENRYVQTILQLAMVDAKTKCIVFYGAAIRDSFSQLQLADLRKYPNRNMIRRPLKYIVKK